MTGFELRAHRIAAINEVENLMARHIYYHACCFNKEELDNIWTRLQPDEAAWKQNFGWWYTMDHIYPYYAPESAKIRGENIRLELMEARPELAERLKSIDGRKLSEMSTHVLSSSVIEIAEDGMSARGLWYTPGFALRGFGGQLGVTWMYEKYGGDFIYEDGEWKFLHLLICMDIMGNGDTTDWCNPAPMGGPGGPPPAGGPAPGGPAPGGPAPGGPPPAGGRTRSGPARAAAAPRPPSGLRRPRQRPVPRGGRHVPRLRICGGIPRAPRTRFLSGTERKRGSRSAGGPPFVPS